MCFWQLLFVHNKVNLNTTDTSHKAHKHFFMVQGCSARLHEVAIAQGKHKNQNFLVLGLEQIADINTLNDKNDNY